MLGAGERAWWCCSTVTWTAPLNAGPLNTGPLNARPLNTGLLNAGLHNDRPLNTGPLDARPLNVGPLNTGPLGAGPLSTLVGFIPSIYYSELNVIVNSTLVSWFNSVVNITVGVRLKGH